MSDEPNALEHRKFRFDVVKFVCTTSLTAVVAVIGWQLTQAQNEANRNQQQAQAALAQRWRDEDAARKAEQEARARRDRQSEELVSQRVKLWDSIARPINRIYSYFMFVGRFKEMTSKEVVAYKRDVDEVVYSYRSVFSKEFCDAWLAFTHETFAEFQGGWGKDAPLRTVPRFKETNEDGRFHPEDNRVNVQAAYNRLLLLAGDELRVPVSPEQVPNVPVPPTP